MSAVIKIKRKSGFSYRIQYYHKSKRYYENFPPGVPLPLVKARQQQIDSALALDKANLKPFKPSQDVLNNLTLTQFASWYQTIRLNESNCAASTLARYVQALTLFARSIGLNFHVRNITTKEIEQFKTQQLAAGKTKNGINHNLHHLISPLKYAQKHGFIEKLPEIVKYKVLKSLPDILLPDQIDLLEKHIPRGQCQLAFQILKWTGIRRAELVDRCFKKDFNFEMQNLLVRGKNNETEKIPLAHQLIEYLKTNPIFNSRNPEDKIITLSKSQISHSIRVAKGRCGIKEKGRTHLLRHSLGCYLINHGFDLREVQRILRHKTLYMTTIYTKILDEKLNAKFQQITYK